MPAAARVGDTTKHGTPLGPGPGSPNVAIEGQRAWRAGVDTNACPNVDPPNKPHVGGPVTNGSTKVFINGFPAARQGDVITDAGLPSPNTIVAGSPKVTIG